jgi:hypothetical protein
MFRPTVIAVVFAMLSAFHAQADDVEAAIATFLTEDGFVAQDIDAVEVELARAFFPSDSAMRPDQHASAIEKALLLVEAMEEPLSRLRYMVRYGQMMRDHTPVSFVTVERYNMGPTIRQSVIDAFGEDDTAGPEYFGVGPHVAWRIVTIPLMGQTAAIMEAARREIDDGEASLLDCGGRGCLFDDIMGELHAWQEVTTEIDVATAYPSIYENGVSTPAFAAAELLILSGLIELDGDRPMWRGPEQPEAARPGEPFLFVGIDFNLGQDDGVDAMLGQTLLNDDALEDIWYRRVQFPDEPAPGLRYWMQAAIERSR